MSLIYECDRCAQRMAGKPAHQLQWYEGRSRLNSDLCERCYKEFLEWVAADDQPVR